MNHMEAFYLKMTTTAGQRRKKTGMDTHIEAHGQTMETQEGRFATIEACSSDKMGKKHQFRPALMPYTVGAADATRILVLLRTCTQRKQTRTAMARSLQQR